MQITPYTSLGFIGLIGLLLFSPLHSRPVDENNNLQEEDDGIAVISPNWDSLVIESQLSGQSCPHPFHIVHQCLKNKPLSPLTPEDKQALLSLSPSMQAFVDSDFSFSALETFLRMWQTSFSAAHHFPTRFFLESLKPLFFPIENPEEHPPHLHFTELFLKHIFPIRFFQEPALIFYQGHSLSSTGALLMDLTQGTLILRTKINCLQRGYDSLCYILPLYSMSPEATQSFQELCATFLFQKNAAFQEALLACLPLCDTDDTLKAGFYFATRTSGLQAWPDPIQLTTDLLYTMTRFFEDVSHLFHPLASQHWLPQELDYFEGVLTQARLMSSSSNTPLDRRIEEIKKAICKALRDTKTEINIFLSQKGQEIQEKFQITISETRRKFLSENEQKFGQEVYWNAGDESIPSLKEKICSFLS